MTGLTFFSCFDPEASWVLDRDQSGEQRDAQQAQDLHERMCGRCELCQDCVGNLSMDGGLALCDDCTRDSDYGEPTP